MSTQQKAPTFKVTAGAAGVMYEGPDRVRAKAMFDTCVEASKDGKGLVGDENVTLMQNEEIHIEYNAETKQLAERKGSNNGAKQWGMALAGKEGSSNMSVPVEPPTRPGTGGMWMKTGSANEAVDEGKACKDCGKCPCKCDDDEDEDDDTDESIDGPAEDMVSRLREAKGKLSAAQLRRQDKMRKKREARGRGMKSTPAKRMSAKKNLKKTKTKRMSAAVQRQAKRTRKRRERLRGK